MALKLWLRGLEAPLVGQVGKNLPAVQETRARALGGEIFWRRKRQPTLVFLPGESQGQRSLADYSPWGRKESHTTWRLINNKEASSESIQQSTETRVQDWVPKEARDRWVGPFSWQFHCI